MTCASCGEDKELCQSAWMGGIKQPRMCKDCLMEYMSTGIDDVKDVYWIKQLIEAGETESLKLLSEEQTKDTKS